MSRSVEGFIRALCIERFDEISSPSLVLNSRSVFSTTSSKYRRLRLSTEPVFTLPLLPVTCRREPFLPRCTSPVRGGVQRAAVWPGVGTDLGELLGLFETELKYSVAVSSWRETQIDGVVQ